MGGIYSGEAIVYTQEDMERFLTAIGDGVAEHEHGRNEASDIVFDKGTCVSRAEYRVTLPPPPFPGSSLYYCKNDATQYYRSCSVYAAEWNFGKNIYRPADAMFREPKDFAFATAQEAEQSVRDALAVLGLEDLVCLRVRYVDHEGMRELGQLLSTDEMFAPMKGGPAENNGYPVKEDWSEADDCYVFIFGTGVDGTAMSYYSEDRTPYNYISSQIIVCYGAEGILSVDIDKPWKAGECLEGPKPLILPEDILEQATDFYANVLSYEAVCIEEIRLEYQYRQVRDAYELFPVWRVTVSSKGAYSDLRYYEYMQFDALTGEEL